jgi:hypothetical protein
MRTKSVRQFGCSNVRLFGGRKEAGRRREEISDFEFDGLKNSGDSGVKEQAGGSRRVADSRRQEAAVRRETGEGEEKTANCGWRTSNLGLMEEQEA